MHRLKILIVDDDLINIRVLIDMLSNDYDVITARNGRMAIEYAEMVPDLILLDIMMPDMNGYEVCKQLKTNEITHKIPVIFVTVLDSDDDESKGFECGAIDYITKPLRASIVKARIKTHLALSKFEQQLESQNEILERMVNDRTKALYESRLEIVHRLVFAAEYKDTETGLHIQRMSNYSEIIAKKYGLNTKDCETILHASPMHDIGKIGIPDKILLKPAKLTPDEWEIMKSHTIIGDKLLANSKSELICAGQQIAIAHHEKWDGSGYPFALKGEKIPILGRITAIADVFDALTTRRPYKEPWPIEKAIETIQQGRGFHFDPDVVDAFNGVIPQLIQIKGQFSDRYVS